MTIPPPSGVTVDAHQHLWDPAQGDYPWMTGRFAPLRREYATEQLIPELTAHSVHATVVVQVRADSAETRDLLALTTRHRFLAGVVGWVDLAVEQFGIPRLLFGSDWPVCELAASYGQVLTAVRHGLTALDPAQTGQVFGLNAVKVYHLDLCPSGPAICESSRSAQGGAND